MEFQTLQYVELNCFSMAILLLIFLNIRHQYSQYLTDQKLFLALVSVAVLILFFDTVMWILDGKSGNHVKLIYIFSAVMYNILNPIICIIWYSYIDFYINGNKEHLNKVLILMLPLVLINLVLSIASIFINIYFVIDDSNIYHRGDYVYILLAICLSIFIYTTAFIVQNRKKISKKEYLYLLFFGIPPAIGGIIQYVFYGVVIIWICATVSILIIFVNIQNDQLHRDYLTGLYNRRSLDGYLSTKIKNRNNTLTAGIMIDLDSFKMVNDLYGHHSGDQALKHIASILKNTFRKKDFIARYGGDEFIVIMEIYEQSDLVTMIQRLNENVSLFNIQKSVPYKISLSIGCDCFSNESETEMTAAEFLMHIDNLMYLNKQRQHTQEHAIR